MDALKGSIGGKTKVPPATRGKKSRKAAADQKEMLLPIAGKKEAAKDEAKKPVKTSTRQRKAG